MREKCIGAYIENVRPEKESRVELPQFDVQNLHRHEGLFSLLNDKDRDILYLIFVSKKKQKAVQRILKRSQPSLCYDIRRIRERIQFIVYLKQVFDIFLDFVETHGEEYDTNIIEVLVMMYYTTSLTQTSRVLGIPQIRVRYIFQRALRQIRDNQHWAAYEIFSAISHNKNKVKRLYRERSLT